MTFDTQIKEIRQICKELLENKTVDMILAYKDGGIQGTLIPAFIKKPEDIESIQWGDRCYQHLANYLYGRKDKVGIVAKPCDVRAILSLILELQLKREDVYIIGVDCVGMKNENGDIRPGCNDCHVHIPPLFDTHIVDERAATLDETAVSTEEKEDLVKNLSKFQQEIDKCILCFSCRQACYGCYCKSCFIERDMPGWSPTEIDNGTKMTFHLGRVMHLAGRCIECGSCEAACASGVNVRYIIKEVTNFIDETYDYKSGMDFETIPALLTYKFEDREVGFLGGEKDV